MAQRIVQRDGVRVQVRACIPKSVHLLHWGREIMKGQHLGGQERDLSMGQ